MLSKVDDDDLAAYVVWVPRNRAQERHVRRVTGIVTDPRATQYWDGDDAVMPHFDRMFSLTGPCAGIFMVYGREAVWTDTAPPRPAYYEDAHARQYKRAGPQFNGRRFAERVIDNLRR